MKLLLRRDQRAGLMGKPIFTLDVRAELEPDEKDRIKKYRLQDTELYASHELKERGSGLLGAASRFAYKAIILTVLVKDLENGKRIEAKDVVELLAIEDQIRSAAQTFKQVLDAASHFGGEEVIAL